MKTADTSTQIRHRSLGGIRCFAALLLTGMLVQANMTAQAQAATQVFQLRPGWNVIWLEVDPTDRAPGAVFKDIPLASVWTWSERAGATDFI